MADYQQIRAPDGTVSTTILRRIDSAYIPDDPASTDATLGAGLTNLSTSDQTDLEGESVANWLDGLIDARVITEERKAELLAPVEPGQPARSVWR